MLLDYIASSVGVQAILIYDFEWNVAKEKENIRKHSLNFRQATSVFRDPNQLVIYDEEHSEEEDRWITMGIDSSGILRVVIHTVERVDDSVTKIRIISARKATKIEEAAYLGDE